MHVHLPKPLHGWRAFAGEVGIIVIGVLIALGAEQIVEAWHWRNEARDFSKAVDHELGLNLGTYDAAIKQRPCVFRRLNELELFLAKSTAGERPLLQRRIGWPKAYSPYTSVWNNRGADVTAHLPGDRRLRYAELYDEFANYDALRQAEREVWRELAVYNQPEALDHSDRMRLRGLLARAEQMNLVTVSNYDFIVKLARPLGIVPVGEKDLVPLAMDAEFCGPLLAQADSRNGR